METVQWTDVTTAVAASVTATAAVLTLGALVAAGIVAWHQLNEMRRQRQAQLMADLSRRWDEAELVESRTRVGRYKNRDELRDAVEKFHRRRAEELFILLKVPNFFEDLGVMVHPSNRSISVELVRMSLGGVVRETWQNWAPAVNFLRERTRRRTIYENFQWLSEQM